MTKSQKKSKKSTLRCLLLLPVFGIALTQLFLSCSLSTHGGEISILLENKEGLEKENQILENKVAKLSSLSLVRERAERELGMIRVEAEFLSSLRLAQLPHPAD